MVSVSFTPTFIFLFAISNLTECDYEQVNLGLYFKEILEIIAHFIYYYCRSLMDGSGKGSTKQPGLGISIAITDVTV
jgi:hypothetical protein